ncbi:septum formation family protein [Leifsonia poae]|uniref:septum formation family protein n=1 Tax=Leifsonia poae TaxID=110933 RepID=UPI001CBD6894|nr:septum formation family protein [Leifsonia poae]
MRPTRRPHRSAMLAAVVAALMTVSLTACVPFGDVIRDRFLRKAPPSATAPADPSGGTDAAPDSGGTPTDFPDLVVGECIDDLDDSYTGPGFPVVDCSVPHDSEIYAIPSVGSGSYPGDTAVENSADTSCHDAFAAYVGIAPEAAEAGWSSYPPVEETWDQIHSAICVVYLDGQTTGSLKGSAQPRGEQNS